jgi:hypothetical protein
MVDAFSLFSINNLLTVSLFTKEHYLLKTTTDLVSFLFSFRFEVNEKEN